MSQKEYNTEKIHLKEKEDQYQIEALPRKGKRRTGS